MKIPQTSEYISVINGLIKTQNKRVKKYFTIEEKEKSIEKIKYTEVMDKFETIKNYVSMAMLPELEINMENNHRYIINFIEDILPENNSKYFKIIIKNKINNRTHFIIVSYDFREINVKIKSIEANDDFDIDMQVFSLEKFTKGKLRKIFFEYFQEIIISDTLPDYNSKEDKLNYQENSSISELNIEIERMKKIAERNKQMMIEANAKKNALRKQIETEKKLLLKDNPNEK